MGCSQREAATELKVSQSVISRLQQRHRETGRVTERHRGGRPLATSHADDHFIVNSALWNWIMNPTQLQACLREVRGTRVSRQTRGVARVGRDKGLGNVFSTRAAPYVGY